MRVYSIPDSGNACNNETKDNSCYNYGYLVLVLLFVVLEMYDDH